MIAVVKYAGPQFMDWEVSCSGVRKGVFRQALEFIGFERGGFGMVSGILEGIRS